MNLFNNWCALNGEKPHLATPAVVARFVCDIAPMGISQVWQAVQEVSRTFYIIGVADPTLGGPVAAAVNAISKVPAPRSWPRDEQHRFLTLPYDLQVQIERRERDRDNQIRNMQNEFARLKKESEEHASTPSATNAVA